MSTINVRPSRDAASSVNYVLYGSSEQKRKALVKSSSTRAAAMAVTVGGVSSTPAQFLQRAEMLTQVHGRKVQLQSYVLAFHPDEFDVSSPGDMARIRDVAVRLTERMHSADYMVVVHSDAAGGHGHAHILVTNHDNLTGKSLQRYTSWKHGLRQVNDELMTDLGLCVLPDPAEPKPDWELRREAFAVGGFEQTLGDKVAAALGDRRSVDRDAFELVLTDAGVSLAVTDRDGWSYKLRREDNGKIGRKKASGLSPEFTAEGARPIFEYHAKKLIKGGPHGHSGQYQKRGRAVTGGRAVTDFGTIESVDVAARRRGSANREADDTRQRPEQVPGEFGRGSISAEGVDLEAARAVLTGARLRDKEQAERAQKRDEEQAERARKDGIRHRVDAERIAEFQASQRRNREAVGLEFIHDDEADSGKQQDDDYGLG